MTRYTKIQVVGARKRGPTWVPRSPLLVLALSMWQCIPHRAGYTHVAVNPSSWRSLGGRLPLPSCWRYLGGSLALSSYWRSLGGTLTLQQAFSRWNCPPVRAGALDVEVRPSRCFTSLQRSRGWGGFQLLFALFVESWSTLSASNDGLYTLLLHGALFCFFFPPSNVSHLPLFSLSVLLIVPQVRGHIVRFYPPPLHYTPTALRFVP